LFSANVLLDRNDARQTKLFVREGQKAAGLLKEMAELPKDKPLVWSAMFFSKMMSGNQGCGLWIVE
jgi:hypothetical protein